MLTEHHCQRPPLSEVAKDNSGTIETEPPPSPVANLEALRCHTIELADPRAVRAYVQDLRGLLEASAIVEQKAFMKSFVEGIDVGQSEFYLSYRMAHRAG